MNEQVVVEPKRRKNLSPPRGAGAAGKSSRRYPPEFRFKAFRLHLEEGFTQNTVCTELDVGHTCLCRWAKLYRAFGETGLQPAPTTLARSAKLPTAVRHQRLALKQDQPTFAFLPASTSRKTNTDEPFPPKPASYTSRPSTHRP